MGREVRRVPPDWRHPKRGGEYVPLFGGSYARVARAWDEECERWCGGWRPEYGGDVARDLPDTPEAYAEWTGQRPIASDYMPDWPAGACSHLQMYETTSEGTPISPVMQDPEALAAWLVAHRVGGFGDIEATYDWWLARARPH